MDISGESVKDRKKSRNMGGGLEMRRKEGT